MQHRDLKLFLMTASCLVLAACSGDHYGGHDQPKVVKIGKPYQVKGESYVPRYEPQYEEEGLASWYGPGFHGKPTATGEIYDQNEMTAAHRTLPMPSIVRVTLLKTGKSVIARVNDRGPFSQKRIIDLSEKTAKEIGLIKYGVSKVHVEYLQEETEEYLAKAGIPEPDWMKEKRAIAGYEVKNPSRKKQQESFSSVAYAGQYEGKADTKDDLPASYVPSQGVTPPAQAIAKKEESSFFSRLAFWKSEDAPKTTTGGVPQETFVAAEVDSVAVADVGVPAPVSIETSEVEAAPISVAVADVSSSPAPEPVRTQRRMIHDEQLPKTLQEVAKPTLVTPFSEPSTPLAPEEVQTQVAQRSSLEEPANLMNLDVLPPVQDAAPTASVSMDLPKPKAPPVLTRDISGSGQYAVQTGAFSSRQNAQKQVDALKAVADASIRESDVAGAKVYRVVVGQLVDASQARQLQEKIVARGYADARIIKD